MTTKPCAYREVVEKFPHLRSTVCEKLISTLPEVKSGKVFRGILWILSEYVESVDDIQVTLQQIRKVIGEIPILASEQNLLDEANAGVEVGEEKEKAKEGGGRPKVLADGTYATETAFTSSGAANLEAVKAASKPPLRSTQTTYLFFKPLPSTDDSCAALILGGDYFTGAVLAASLAKLVLRFDRKSQDKVTCNTLRAEVATISLISHSLLTTTNSPCLL